MSNPTEPFTIEQVTDPAEIAAANAQHAQFLRNHQWYQTIAHLSQDRYPGQVICIAGQELFAATTVEEAVELARTAHPDDQGRFFLRIPKVRAERIYAF